MGPPRVPRRERTVTTAGFLRILASESNLLQDTEPDSFEPPHEEKKNKKSPACGDCRDMIYLPSLILRASDIEEWGFF